MATVINTKFSSICLTADLPEEVEIESLTPQVTVTISIDEVEVFSSAYYIYGLKAYVRDIQSIVESAMLQKKLAIASFVLNVKDYEILQRHLSSAFGVPVKFTCDKSGKGKITFPFTTEEQLEKIISIFDNLKNS